MEWWSSLRNSSCRLYSSKFEKENVNQGFVTVLQLLKTLILLSTPMIFAVKSSFWYFQVKGFCSKGLNLLG